MAVGAMMQVSVRDIRQGREMPTRQLIAELKRIADTGIVNARRDTAIIRQAAAMLENARNPMKNTESRRQ